jgi:hypothetical protein
MMHSIRAGFLVSAALLLGIAGLSIGVQAAPTFIPNNQQFWDDSTNWTTDYGPAYRDTVEQPSNMVPCMGEFALCFTSGPEPLPCELSKDGRTADCTCTAQNGLNFVLISAILNYDVYLDTINTCKPDGSLCVGQVNKAPVCAYINSGKFSKGADLISTFDVDAQARISDSLAVGPPLTCEKAPYAACMTAACKQKKDEKPVCSCPVFDGVFQLPSPGASCDAGPGLIPSASFASRQLNP